MRPDHSKLGANVGFGYLTDDDDDDATGGAGADEFDALVNAGLVASANVGDTVSFQIDAITGSGAQTSGSVRVSLSGVTLSAAPTTVGLAGWSASGWTLSSGEWFNTLTKSSLAVGTTSPTFSAVPSAAGTLTITTNYGGAHAPHTAEATGAGNSRSVTIAAVSFDVSPGTSVGTIASGDSFTLTAYVVAGGLPQTGGFFRLKVGSSTESGVDMPADLDLDGWTASSGWIEVTPGSGIWQADYVISTVASAAYEVTVTVTPTAVGTVTCQTNVSPLPFTDQASGIGYFATVTVTA